MKTVPIKKEARKLVDNLPNDSSWEDLMHEVYVREAIEAGLQDSRDGNVCEVAVVRKKYGLD